MQKMWVWSLGREDPVEKEMATLTSILAWEITWTEEPGGLQSMVSQKSQPWFSNSTTTNGLSTLPPHFPPFCSIKETNVQTLVRWFSRTLIFSLLRLLTFQIEWLTLAQTTPLPIYWPVLGQGEGSETSYWKEQWMLTINRKESEPKGFRQLISTFSSCTPPS